MQSVRSVNERAPIVYQYKRKWPKKMKADKETDKAANLSGGSDGQGLILLEEEDTSPRGVTA
ncbi:unnamed protein product [Arabis nemorensis]|uniref:Uncharacterized protein n=1 Tax=Arabis nemorensis TaxID=586526 RepID=A0A565BNX2_9BRAS|nr:unnamed protein product [Arabis nemorensis]